MVAGVQGEVRSGESGLSYLDIPIKFAVEGKVLMVSGASRLDATQLVFAQPVRPQAAYASDATPEHLRPCNERAGSGAVFAASVIVPPGYPRRAD